MENYSIETLLNLHALCFFIVGFLVRMGIEFFNRPAKDDNRCCCADVNECDKWCNSKIMFTKDHNYSITEICLHPNVLLEVIDTTVTCETTIEVCADCGVQLSQPKTDCA